MLATFHSNGAMAAGFSPSIVSIYDRSALRVFPPAPARREFPVVRLRRSSRLSSMNLLSRRLPVVAAASPAAAAGEDSTKKPARQKSLREKLTAFIDEQAGYVWLLAPVVVTSTLVLPSLLFSIVDLLQSNYWIGLGTILGVDLAYILAADAFFVLTDKTGHHQKLPGEPSPWIGPWKYTGYPKGLPHVLDYLAYAGIGVAGLGLIFSIFLGRFGTAVAGFLPYVALVLVQAAYERLLCKDKLPTYPLVVIVYTVYRFKQLARAVELFAVFNGGSVLSSTARLLMAIWTFYLAAYLAQLPWMYCTWNANRLS